MPRLRSVTLGLLSAGAMTVAGLSAAAASTHHAPAAVAGHGVTVKTRHTHLGTFLVKGKTLYLFEKDKHGKSRCYHACASAWPPLMTHGAPHAAGKVKGAKLGTVKRKTGGRQVTYNGHPLYFYAGDSGHQTNGEGLDQFGAEWYVVNPKGNKIDSD
jgi:predicted lipoprotein with Yx(FWY)xxD motif